MEVVPQQLPLEGQSLSLGMDCTEFEQVGGYHMLAYFDRYIPCFISHYDVYVTDASKLVSLR